MVQINNVSISNDGTEIYIDVQSHSRDGLIKSITLWDNHTFKDFGKGIDISFKIVGESNREIFTLTRNDVELDNFEGIWYLEFEDDSELIDDCSDCNNPQLVVLTNFNSIYRCIANELNKMDLCSPNLFLQSSSECNIQGIDKILTIQLIIDSVKYNFALGQFLQGNEMYKQLNKLCRNCFNFEQINKSTCTSCN